MGDPQQKPESPGAAEAISLPVTGMTCAACASNIERALKKLPGVGAAGVNYATNRATVTFDPSVLSIPVIVEAIRDVGYDVIGTRDSGLPPSPNGQAAGYGVAGGAGDDAVLEDLEQRERDREYNALRFKFVLATALAVPV